MKYRLLLDEDIHGPVATALRVRGMDVARTQEVGTQGATDEDQLATAIRLERAFVTFNRGDFARLHRKYILSSRHHFGILVSRQIPPGELIKRILAFFEQDHNLHDGFFYL